MEKESVLTPLELEVLLHYYYSRSDYPKLHLEPVNNALERFVDAGLLKALKTTSKDNPVYFSANMELLRPYIHQVLSIPLPNSNKDKKSIPTINIDDFISGTDPYSTSENEKTSVANLFEIYKKIGTKKVDNPGDFKYSEWSTMNREQPYSTNQIHEQTFPDKANNCLSLSKEDIWYLADIAWYIKGYVASKSEDDKNNFGQSHVDVLTKVINEVKRDN